MIRSSNTACFSSCGFSMMLSMVKVGKGITESEVILVDHCHCLLSCLSLIDVLSRTYIARVRRLYSRHMSLSRRSERLGLKSVIQRRYPEGQLTVSHDRAESSLIEVAIMSNAEVLQEELEVLESIFPDELERELNILNLDCVLTVSTFDALS